MLFPLGSYSFSIELTSLGEERTGLCTFRAFVWFARVGLWLFPLSLGVRDWLRHVIVVLHGLFFLTFYIVL